jgi:hypothetical protein
MNAKITRSIVVFVILIIFLSACQSPSPSPQVTQTVASTLTSPPPTSPPSPTPAPTNTPSPTNTHVPTDTLAPTAIPATATQVPQELLLRRKCGRDYVVQKDYPLRLFYGGWGVIGQELADEWMDSLVIELTIDGESIPGELQAPSQTLPHNCEVTSAGIYWLYSITTLPSLTPGTHDLTVTISAIKVLPDGSGLNYGPGELLTQTFTITAQ